jgi:hypothetical protein
VEVVADSGHLEIMARGAPEDLPGPANVGLAGWMPGNVVAATVHEDLVVVLDARGPEVVSLSLPDLGRRSGWGSAGSGPGEMRAPVALALDGGSIWIADADLNRVTRFDQEGRYQSSFSPDGRLSLDTELAVEAGGNVHLANPALGPALPSRGGPRVVVRSFTPDGRKLANAFELDDREMLAERLVLPGPNPVRLKAARDRMVVFYPASGIADIVRDGQIDATVRRCMGERLRAIYERQRADATAQRGSQTWMPLLTDVHLTEDGEVWLVGPLGDELGRFHIDRYDGTGRLMGSLVAPGELLRATGDVRFAGTDGRRVLSYDRTGNILLAEVVTTSP